MKKPALEQAAAVAVLGFALLACGGGRPPYTAQHVNSADGRPGPWYVIRCGRDRGNCLIGASDVCSYGYDVVDTESQNGWSASGGAFRDQAHFKAGSHYTGTMLVRCLPSTPAPSQAAKVTAAPPPWRKIDGIAFSLRVPPSWVKANAGEDALSYRDKDGRSWVIVRRQPGNDALAYAAEMYPTAKTVSTMVGTRLHVSVRDRRGTTMIAGLLARVGNEIIDIRCSDADADATSLQCTSVIGSVQFE